MRKLTELQTRVLDELQEYGLSHGRPPTVRELADLLDRSSSTVFQALGSLEKKGLIRKRDSSSRNIELQAQRPEPSHRHVILIPVVGKVTAGQPIEAIEDRRGYVPVDPDVVGHAEHFALVITGDSMVGAGILDGDQVLVRKQCTADEGDIVVAMFDNEATVKRFRRDGDTILLVPENPEMEPLRIEGGDFHILGKVVGVFRSIE